MRALPVGFLLLAAAAAASCGDSAIDAAKAQRLVRGTVAGQLHSRVVAVTCPDDVKAQDGARFTCVVRGADGSQGPAVVTQRDDGALSVSAPFLNVREAESVMAAQIGRQIEREDVRVTCPEIVVDRRDGRFTCRATAGGRSARVAVRLTDGAGHFQFGPVRLPR
jgi:uncharacterized protein DUF4333